MGRSRSRSPARRETRRRSRSPDRGGRERYRSRSRSRERRRDGANPYDRDKERMRRATGPSTNSLTPEQQEQLAKLQQAEMQRQLQRQQVLLNNGAGGLNAAMAANKKQREVYCGNLVIGGVTDLMLRELFNAALAQFVPDPVTSPPVVSVTMDGSGRFGFVELRTEELSSVAMKLDKINICGREVNVGRPKGYIEPPPGSQRDPNAPTLTLFMEGMLSIGQVRDALEREDLQLEVQDELSPCGDLLDVRAPEPPTWIPNEEPCPIFARFGSLEACKKAKDMMNGRSFEANTVTAKFISDDLWHRVTQSEWVDHKMVIAPPAPSANLMGSQPAAMAVPSMNNYPNLLPQALMGAGYAVSNALPGAPAQNSAATGFLVRIAGMPSETTKFDIVGFLQGCALGEGHIRLVKDTEGGATGEAFVDCPDPESMARALEFDHTPMGTLAVYVSVISSSVEERNAKTTAGFRLA